MRSSLSGQWPYTKRRSCILLHGNLNAGHARHRLPAEQGVAGEKGRGQRATPAGPWSTHTLQLAAAWRPAASRALASQVTRPSCAARTATPTPVASDAQPCSKPAWPARRKRLKRRHRS